ncbi:Metallo-dependent hydrolase [Neolentinus lepideus HHB14362 ss-1]|uniref:Metallo-dependent hydrolase n=1 Tax=Neolentinus lepideus HHB14362 ss-1 TaxID=1314782 RepID=A0A165MDY9_9AGAM|nr:Metallo-dependent hydrolase [Neolentinus lepideus HHB14362 ss-1]
MSLSSYASEALSSLSDAQLTFLQGLPKAELHAHLNGSIPLDVLQEMARDYISAHSSDLIPVSGVVQKGVENLTKGVVLNEIHDFFGLFPAIYALTSSPATVAKAARAVLESFLDGSSPQCTYMELRSTPRATDLMDRHGYLQAVLGEVERYPAGQAALIVSIDRRMDEAIAEECVNLAITLKQQRRRVVGIDLCGDPLAGDLQRFVKHFQKAKSCGLGVTVHIAETADNPASETDDLLRAFAPSRLGHATFLDQEAMRIVFEKDIAVEICLTSNLLCKTVQSLEDHHIRFYLERNHAIAICTDDQLPFRTNLTAEYALLLAKPPLGLGLTQDEVKKIAAMSLSRRFSQ